MIKDSRARPTKCQTHLPSEYPKIKEVPSCLITMSTRSKYSTHTPAIKEIRTKFPLNVFQSVLHLVCVMLELFHNNISNEINESLV